ncbi:unnamed protein product [Kuraishia capsulata CBS 1993]|uniref:DUF3533 domain-containing protein n=1 Tax=Kuraishia capsulata CBS 1993 TaxID=1382522 RepID=W6MPC4_9ASCO|nr:uncharacterized protein KUCA_T00002939001 [Kuraishia capsulata CBS 1993]CDK26962.1 unnamed protein product [Kuraishia capsulata CBS 1993]
MSSSEPVDRSQHLTGPLEPALDRTRSNNLNDIYRSVSHYTEASVFMGDKDRVAEGKQESSGSGSQATFPAGPPGPPTQQQKRKVSFFSREFLGYRKRFFKTYPVMLLIMLTCMFGIFSIYWGSMYQRNSRFKNLKMLVVVEDPVDGHLPVFSQAINETSYIESVKYRGDWKVMTHSDVTEMTGIADPRGATYRLIHHQKYWSAVYVNANATSNYATALEDADSSFRLNGSVVEVIYETGRDMTAMQSYVTPGVKVFEETFLSLSAASAIKPLTANLSSSALTKVAKDTTLLSQVPTFTYTDEKPITNPVVLAPSQIGLIYLIILTFFQFNFFIKLHGEMAHHMNTTHYLVYRLLSAHGAYLVLSLGYSAISAAFQVDFSQAYKGGFGVQWMVSYLTMAAVGGANENIALICFATMPPLVGFWMLFWVIFNISPTFSPIVLCPDFYRYGYMTPIHNSYEATKVIIFNTWKGELGRNIGILIAWIVIHTLVFPLCVMFFAWRAQKPGTAAFGATRAPPPIALPEKNIDKEELA